MPFRTALPERGSKLLTTLLHLSRPTHPYIVVMTLAVIMRPGRHHAAGPSSCEASTHRVDGGICGSKCTPFLCLANPLIQATVTRIHGGFYAHRSRIASFLLYVATQLLDSLTHLTARLPQRKPAIGNASSTSQHNIRSPPSPDGN